MTDEIKKRLTRNNFKKCIFPLFLFVFGMLVIIIWIEEIKTEPEITTFNETEICSSIRGTPAWIYDNGTVKDYGYKQGISIEDLIKEKIHFIYSSGCGWCHQQIDEWDDFELYQQENLTTDCLEIMK